MNQTQAFSPKNGISRSRATLIMGQHPPMSLAVYLARDTRMRNSKQSPAWQQHPASQWMDKKSNQEQIFQANSGRVTHALRRIQEESISRHRVTWKRVSREISSFRVSLITLFCLCSHVNIGIFHWSLSTEPIMIALTISPVCWSLLCACLG